MPEVTRLKSTNERVTVLEEFRNGKTGEEMLRVKLQPQLPWHKARIENVRESKTVTQRSNI